MLEQLIGIGPQVVIDLERFVQEVDRLRRDEIRQGRLGGRTNLEKRLHLIEICPGVGAADHLHNQASKTPNIGFASVRRLLDDFGRHPEHAALQGGAVCSTSCQEI